MTDWKTWPKCGFFNVFFFFFFWAANVSDLSRSQLWNMELDFGWTRYKAEHKSWRSLLFKVFHCVCHIISFLVFFDKQGIKNWKKNQASKKNSNLEFCWIKRAPKNKCARQLWDIGFIFFSLIWLPTCYEYHCWDDKSSYLKKVKYSGEHKKIHCCQYKIAGHISYKVPCRGRIS